MRFSIFKASLLLLLGAFVGCDWGGPKMYPVSGEIRFQGELVPRGMISFIPDDPAQRTAATRIEGGKYNLRMTAGTRSIQIMATRDNGPIDPVMGQAPQVQYVPERYNVETELHVEITPDGENLFNYDLQSARNAR